MSNNITSIGDYAFSGDVNLTEIIIPNSVITLGNNAFEKCTKLSKFYIGSGITSIGTNCFALSSIKDTKLYTTNQVVLDYDWASNKRNIIPMNTFRVTLPEEIILKPKYLNSQEAPIWYASFDIEVYGDFEDGSYGTFSEVSTFNISTASGEQITVTTDVKNTTLNEDGALVIPVTFTALNPTLLKEYSGTFTLDTVLHEVVPFAA